MELGNWKSIVRDISKLYEFKRNLHSIKKNVTYRKEKNSRNSKGGWQTELPGCLTEWSEEIHHLESHTHKVTHRLRVLRLGSQVLLKSFT